MEQTFIISGSTLPLIYRRKKPFATDQQITVFIFPILFSLYSQMRPKPGQKKAHALEWQKKAHAALYSIGSHKNSFECKKAGLVFVQLQSTYLYIMFRRPVLFTVAVDFH